MTGRLVISLDFELMWSVRDHRTTAEYGDAVLGGRAAIPEVLKRFASRGIRATWATVGFVFAQTRDEILDHAAHVRPHYLDPRSSPYAFIQNGLGRNENEDPLHFGYSLVERIAETHGQEVATHSFSHFCCLEPGHSPDAFAADLTAAHNIARTKGHRLETLVFARNQMDDRYVSIAKAQGIKAYRGNPPGFAYSPRPASENGKIIRLARLLDSVIPVAGRLDYPDPSRDAGVTNIPASRFLRPFNPAYPAFSWFQVRRIHREMEIAARDNRIYHLWWHPHNFGRSTAGNLRQLDSILDRFVELRGRYGMQSCTMKDLS
ncbi:MAG TPA: hypothetical protein VEZ26_06090 [Sphingomonadaceae bacterium]|nr:hypothetical protein [Sphingomonadaceae bacterium]